VASPKALVPTEEITRAILTLRGQRVIPDAELATLYGVTTKRLNEQVKRNAKRFPEDFMFQLTAEEATGLRSQIATSKPVGRGGRRYQPYTRHSRRCHRRHDLGHPTTHEPAATEASRHRLHGRYSRQVLATPVGSMPQPAMSSSMPRRAALQGRNLRP